MRITEKRLRSIVKEEINELQRFDQDGRRLGRSGARVAADQMIHDYKTKGMSKGKLNNLVRKLSQRFSCKCSDIKDEYRAGMERKGLSPQI